MSWAKLDDRFLLNAKIMQAGLEGRALYVAALCYCAGELTDGFVARNVAYKIAILADVEHTDDAITRLVGLKLWEPVEGGWLIHDYLEYNPSREKALATKEARAEAGARGGQQKAMRQAAESNGGSVANGQQNPSKLLDTRQDGATNILKQNSTPSPSPSPDDLNPQKDHTPTSGASAETRSEPPVDNFTPWWNALWSAYPGRAGKKVNKAAAKRAAQQIPARDRDRVTVAVANFAHSRQAVRGYAPDMHRFLQPRKDDVPMWQEWETPEDPALAVIGGTDAPGNKLNDKLARIEQQIAGTLADSDPFGGDPGPDYGNVPRLRALPGPRRIGA